MIFCISGTKQTVRNRGVRKERLDCKCMGLDEYLHKDMANVAPFYHLHFTLQQKSQALLERLFFVSCSRVSFCFVFARYC